MHECIGWATGLRKNGRKRREEEARCVSVLGAPPNWAEHNLHELHYAQTVLADSMPHVDHTCKIQC